jgi:hypothetical protein
MSWGHFLYHLVLPYTNPSQQSKQNKCQVSNPWSVGTVALLCLFPFRIIVILQIFFQKFTPINVSKLFMKTENLKGHSTFLGKYGPYSIVLADGSCIIIFHTK